MRLLEPSAAPAEAQRLGVDPLVGGLALTMGNRTEDADTATEQDITAAIARLLRGRPRSLCVTSGHGETATGDSTDHGLSTAAGLLAQNGYRLRTIDLLVQPDVPAGCDAVLVAAPTAPLGTGASDALASYLARGGRAVVLADPVSTVDLNPLLRPYGLGIRRGIVLETDPAARFPDDPTRPAVLSYESPNPIVHRLPPTFFPGVEQVTVASGTAGGLSAAALAETSDRSYLERNPADVSHFDPGQDVRGPITIAAAADRSANLGTTVRRTRVVVVGDVDFATNAFIAQAGNGDLLLRAMDWAAIEQDLVTVSANLPAVRPLDLTEGRLGYARFLLALVVPALFLLGGAITWAVRRSR